MPNGTLITTSRFGASATAAALTPSGSIASSMGSAIHTPAPRRTSRLVRCWRVLVDRNIELCTSTPFDWSVFCNDIYRPLVFATWITQAPSTGQCWCRNAARQSPSDCFGFMKRISPRPIHPVRKSTRNHPSLFFLWNRTGERRPNCLRSYCAQVLPMSVEIMNPVW